MTDAQGVALAYPYYDDLQAVDAAWWYVWAPCPLNAPPGCVPMSRDGSDPQLPIEYNGYVLLFNEPHNVEPFGNPIEPDEALQVYMTLSEEYPRAKWVVGNIIFWGHWQNWLLSFHDMCSVTPGCYMPEYWGIHVYVSGNNWIDYIKGELDGLHNYIGGKFWITEFAEVTGNVSMDNAMLELFKRTPYIDRWAYFTNRAHGNEPWYPAGWNVQLFDYATGEPTSIGDWYAHGLHKSFIPMVNNGLP
jgi:hypothetical protein